jgi:Domain of unknown function (DUF4878)
MKQLLFSMAALVTLVLASCGGGSNPKTIATDYLSAVNKMEFEKAKKMGTEDTKKFIDMMNTFSSMIPDSVKKKQGAATIKVEGEPAISGDDATVTYSSSDKPGSQTLKLKKVDGKWLVQQTKEDTGAGELPSANAEEAMPMAADSVKKAK